MRRFVLALALAAIAAAPSAVRAEGPPTTDQEIAQRLADSLRTSGQLNGYSISVKFKDGTARLEGWVRNAQQMNQALDLMRQAPEVRDVVNQLSVRQEPAVRRAMPGKPQTFHEVPSTQPISGLTPSSGRESEAATQLASQNRYVAQPRQGPSTVEAAAYPPPGRTSSPTLRPSRRPQGARTSAPPQLTVVESQPIGPPEGAPIPQPSQPVSGEQPQAHFSTVAVSQPVEEPLVLNPPLQTAPGQQRQAAPVAVYHSMPQMQFAAPYVMPRAMPMQMQQAQPMHVQQAQPVYVQQAQPVYVQQAQPMQFQQAQPMLAVAPAQAPPRVMVAQGPPPGGQPPAAAGGPRHAAAGMPLPAYVPGTGGGVAPAAYDQPYLPNYAWPGYAAYPNYAAVTYPKQYSPAAWPYIGPFYPYPQVPLGWRKVTLEWDDGWWFLDFNDSRRHCCGH
jgi:hypothetical protein